MWFDRRSTTLVRCTAGATPVQRILPFAGRADPSRRSTAATKLLGGRKPAHAEGPVALASGGLDEARIALPAIAVRCEDQHGAPSDRLSACIRHGPGGFCAAIRHDHLDVRQRA